MTDDTGWEVFPDADPFAFRLANGNHVRVVFGHFWTRSRPLDFVNGYLPTHFYGVRIYSNEGTLSERCVYQYEFRTPNEFNAEAVPAAQQWLSDIVANRLVFTFDSLEDFVVAFAEALEHFSLNLDDAASHYTGGQIEERPDDQIDEWFDHC